MSNGHPAVFERFELRPGTASDGWWTNRLGVQERRSFGEHALLIDTLEGVVSPPIPPLTEEYFEWVALLEAVDRANEQFVMMELGAGYGRWLVNGAAAARQRSLSCLLIGVEADPSHFQWMKEHLQDNGICPADHQLLQAAVSDRAGRRWFTESDPTVHYGQGVERGRRARLRSLLGLPPPPGLQRVHAVSLTELLEPLELVDLIDLDVQGEEARVLLPAMTSLTQKVRRLHIGTHGPEIERDLCATFCAAGWTCIADYAFGSTAETPYGSISFGDGVQTWENPRLTSAR